MHTAYNPTPSSRPRSSLDSCFGDAGVIAERVVFSRYNWIAQTSGIKERVTFCSKLFVDTWGRWAGSVSPLYLYILENLQIQVAPGATFKTWHLQLVPYRWISWHRTTFFKEKKMEKKKKKRRIVLNGENGWSWRSWRRRTGQQAHILEKFRKKYVGRAGIWIHDDVRHNSIHGSWKHWCPPYELGMEFAVVVEGNGGTNDKSIWEGQISVRVADFTVTHHCQKRNGVHERRLVPLDTLSACRVGWREELSSGPRKVKVVTNSVLNGN